MAYSESDGDPATVADEAVWSAPVVVNAGEAGQDNVSGLVRFGCSVGLYYTDRHATGDDFGYFATHADADPATTWTTETVANATSSVSDQANIKADASGNVYLVVKTALTSPTSDQVRMYKRTVATGTWSAPISVATVASGNVRPQVALQPTFDGGVGAVIVVMSNSDGAVYYKTAPLSGPGSLTFETIGAGTPFIKSATDTNIFDPTTTKQVITGAMGFLAVATDRTSFYYLHNRIAFPDAADSTAPAGGTISIDGGAARTTVPEVTISPAIAAGQGATRIRLANTTGACTTSGSPAILSLAEATTYGYGTSLPWTLIAGDGTKTVCAQFGDDAGNWSAPVTDTIVLDTAGPTGSVTINGGALADQLARPYRWMSRPPTRPAWVRCESPTRARSMAPAC